MPNVKRKTAKKTAAKKRAAARKSTKRAKTNRPATAKKSVKLTSRTMKAKRSAAAKSDGLTPAQRLARNKRRHAAKKSAATRKANAEKEKRSAAAKKAARGRKRKAKKAKTGKAKRRKVDGRSREARTARRGNTYLKECAKLLLQKKHTDIEIRDKLAAKFGGQYSGGKHTRHIRKYRSLLNSGDLEHAGFKRPAKPVHEIGRTMGAEEAGLTKRAKRARRSAIHQKKIGPRAKYARRRLQTAGSSPGTATTGNSPADLQPTARRARRRKAVPRNR